MKDKTLHPLVSIIIPTYNAGNTITECLESIVTQTFSNWEVIIIDGASTDNTLHYVRDYSENFPTITYTSQKDQGIYDAMNKGIKQSSGAWIYFLGSDDKFADCYILEKVFDESIQTHDLIYGNVFSIMHNRIYDGEFNSSKLLEKNICHQAIFIKREIYNQIGVYDLRFKYCADWAYNIKCFKLKGINIKFIDKIIAIYADGGISSVHKDLIFLNMRHWEILKSEKRSTSLLNKLRSIKAISRKVYKENGLIDVCKIIIDIPNYLISL